MTTLEKNFDFLLKVAKSLKDQVHDLITKASEEEIQSLVECLALRLVHIPLTGSDKSLIARSKRCKRLRQFFIRHHRLLKGIVACILVKFVQDSLLNICDSC
jgi:hypothetical protein